MAETLKPCPFCGGEAELVRNSSGSYFVRCTDRQCAAKTRLFHENENGARASWNRRAERTCRVVIKERRFSQTQTIVSKSCSACGHEFGDEERRPILPGLDETMVLNPVDAPNYCPNCGARVIKEDA